MRTMHKHVVFSAYMIQLLCGMKKQHKQT